MTKMDQMKAGEMRETVRRHPLLAILRNVPFEQTPDYAQAILNGGISFFEVALNSPDGLRQIALLRERLGDRALVGAGTAVTVERAEAALGVGAQFLLAPSSPRAVLEYCANRDIGFLPGVLTPTDVQACLDCGFSTLKLFPAGDMPLSYVRSLKGPYDETDYVAIGGVNARNVREFLEAGCIGAGLGSSLLPRDLVRTGDWEGCSRHIAEIVEKIR